MQVQIVVMLVRETLPQDEIEDLRDKLEGDIYGDVDATLAMLLELSEDPVWDIVSGVNVVDDEEEDAPEE